MLCGRSHSQLSTEDINGVIFHRFYRGIVGQVPLSKYSWRLGGERGRDRLVGLAYRTYLQTVNAAYISAEAGRVIRLHTLDGVIERETAFGAGAIAARMTHRPMLLEVIGPRCSPLSLYQCFKLLAYNARMVPPAVRKKTIYVEAAANTSLFKRDNWAREAIREKYALGDSIVVGYVGTFQSFHGIGDLVRAAGLIIKQMPGVKFLLVGPYSQEVKRLADELGASHALIFVGPVRYEQVPSYINACDILVAPYNTKNSERKEAGIGSPLKVLEYMSVGKPTIGSALPQVAAIISHLKTGMLFPEGDVRALSDAVLELASNRDLRESLGNAAMKQVREKYTWLSLARRVQDIMAEEMARLS